MPPRIIPMVSLFWIFLEGITMCVVFPFQHKVNKNIDELLLLFKYIRDLVDILCITYKHMFYISKTLFLI